MRIWSVIAEMVDSHGRCALVTVVEIRGSAPREPGTRMVIAPDGGFRGTIGGGELEWRAIGVARDVLSGDTPVALLVRLTLGPDLGQCCGGSVRLLTEVFDRDRLDEVRALVAREAAGPFVTRGRIDPGGVERIVDDGVVSGESDSEGNARPVNHPAIAGASAGGGAVRTSRRERQGDGIDLGALRTRPPPIVFESDGSIVERFSDSRRPVWLFGAGHVGRALMLALAPLPFEVIWIDERTNAFPAAMPATVRSMRSVDPAHEVTRAPAGALVVVMTHSHARDLAIVHAALAAGRFGYVGLIGSASKRARFTRRLREAGVSEARIAELVCPIGLPGIRSKHPAAIAAGVAVQLLECDEALGTSAMPMHDAAIGVPR